MKHRIFQSYLGDLVGSYGGELRYVSQWSSGGGRGDNAEDGEIAPAPILGPIPDVVLKVRFSCSGPRHYLGLYLICLHVLLAFCSLVLSTRYFAPQGNGFVIGWSNPSPSNTVLLKLHERNFKHMDGITIMLSR